MSIALAIISIGVLIILHELGHFFLAKKFGVKVEEFGIGMPPRVLGKKWGETLYSLNALPIGGFVRMEGEEKRSDTPSSFSVKPLWQRFFIVAGGVLVFWIIAAFIFAVLGTTVGIPMAVDDEKVEGITNPQVQIIGIAADSPAEAAGIKLGDKILEMNQQTVSTVKEVQDFTLMHKGEEILLTLQRGEEVINAKLAARSDPPSGQGAMGVALARTALIKYPWYEGPFRGVELTGRMTFTIVRTLGGLVADLVAGKGLPPGVQLSGPVGVVNLLGNSASLGIPSFFSFVAILSIYLAIFNTLPIPALDGGRMFFILLEGLRRKPLSEKLEQRLIMISFAVLIPLILWVTVNDITRIF